MSPRTNFFGALLAVVLVIVAMSVFTVDQQKPLDMAPVIRWLEVQMQ